ncbi:MAG: hypothetical protein M5U01_08250 [Ardenticatenaceae bacterium]|nr:hypothetical protein [Ardenticatenaceae bacterium]HBY98288.1 hypothetical protein [Chloroflexota bacterium]
MKMRIVILAAIVALLPLVSVTLAQSVGPAPSSGQAVDLGSASAGRYQLARPAWLVSGTADGEGYHLRSAAEPALRGSGCCCTYVPCLLKQP